MLDAPFSMPDTYSTAQAQLAGRFLAAAARSLGWDTADPRNAPDPAKSTVDEQIAWLAGCLCADGGDSADAVVAVATRLRRRFDVFQAHTRMLAGYQPTASAVRASTLIVSADHSLTRALGLIGRAYSAGLPRRCA